MKWKYIAKRLLIAIPTFLGITVLAFFILNLAPGSPLDALLADPRISPAELERKRVALGLDKPVIIQYFSWLNLLLHGDLGFSYSTQRPVSYRSDSSGDLCGVEAKLKERLRFWRYFTLNDGNPQLLCGSGLYLPVCHCV